MAKLTALLILLSVFSLRSQAQSRKMVWVAGEEFIGRWDTVHPIEIMPAKPKSWGMNQNSCEVWFSDEKETVFRLSPTDKAPVPTTANGKILTETFQDTFLTKSPTDELEAHDRNGDLVKSYGTVPQSTQAVEVGKKHSFLLDYSSEQNHLNLITLSPEFSPVKTTSVSYGGSLWSTAKILFDKDQESVWVGYTSRTPSHMYSPVVELRDSAGAKKYSHSWADRGIFYDMCMEKEGSLTIARDVPSHSGFTVPIYSFLENLKANSAPVEQYAADTNFFIDSMACLPGEVYMLQRSILGSDGSHLQLWHRGESGFGKTLLKLPGRAWKISVCNVE